ncbi:MAG: 1-deoxy-D-xylulose-5-phosphate synthase [Andreesenia angusta]|nr:1-deoxy-D-xylulose-5-phosphate synthase [Andreesenia angusta]
MKNFSKFNNLGDLKRMNIVELNQLATEIREFLIENISRTGGHLASNLGVVELTIALHKVYASGYDKIIWDVGHQSYVHKILTGRKEGFQNLRQFKGMSGFPKRNESIHDVFETGHSSTSISAGLGMAMARDIKGEKYKVIPVIGDGAMTAGMAFEALNHAGDKGTDLTVILNDNEMSISENVGGLAKHLYKLRMESGYYKAKEDFESFMETLPGGETILKSTRRFKDSMKYMLLRDVFFESLGFKYIGPVDGHDMKELIRVFEMVKNFRAPTLIHLITKKGKGYKPAELDPEGFHGIGKFDKNTGKPISKSSEKTYSDVLGETLVKIAEEKEDIVAITAAMPSGTGLDKFKDRFPNRYFDVGIAEQHGVTLAAGLASNGMKPFFAVYSTFLQRAYDQVLHDVSIQNLPVTFAIDRGGLVGNDGETHHGVFDLSYLSHIPNISIMAPKDKMEFEEMIRFGSTFDSPLVIRYSKGLCINCFDGMEFNSIDYGKGEYINRGEKIAIIAIGRMVEIANRIIKSFKSEGKNFTLVNARFVKPIDNELLKEVSKTHDAIITIEDNAVLGGFGSMINKNLIDMEYHGYIKNIGIPDRFIEHGNNEDLYRLTGIDIDGIYETILNIENEIYGD